MYNIKGKHSHPMNFHFPPRSVFLQKYRHVPSAPDKRLKRMVRYKEQEMVTQAIFFIQSHTDRSAKFPWFFCPVCGLQTRETRIQKGLDFTFFQSNCSTWVILCPLLGLQLVVFLQGFKGYFTHSSISPRKSEEGGGSKHKETYRAQLKASTV